MLTVEEALTTILLETKPAKPDGVPLANARGLILAEDILSDVDSPPFDKSLMDGYALRTADLAHGRAELTVIEEVTAGRVPTKSVGPGEATRIMTGAPIPNGCDAVVRIEDTQLDPSGHKVRVTAGALSPGNNLMRRGASKQKGSVVVSAGTKLRPQEIGALAELGKPLVAVRRAPEIGVLATGDELVPAYETPGPGQIRNSNETMLVAQIEAAGAWGDPLGIARDEREHLRECLRYGLRGHDMLILSGGVSAGKLDLVPSELEAAGVREVFHHVNLKPGKPIWYGVYDYQEEGETEPSRCHVFGLPGNPVSSMVCFELFVRTAIRRLMGFPNPAPRPIRARLAVAHKSRGDRPTYHPARLVWRDAQGIVEPVQWQGSADLSATVSANSMMYIPAGDCSFETGELVDVFPWDVDWMT